MDLPAPRREACLARIDQDLFFYGGGLVESNKQPSTKFWYLTYSSVNEPSKCSSSVKVSLLIRHRLFDRPSSKWTRVTDLFVVNPKLNRGVVGAGCVAVTTPNGRRKVSYLQHKIVDVKCCLILFRVINNFR